MKKVILTGLIALVALILPMTVNGHGKFPILHNAWVSITYDPASSPTSGSVATIIENATGIYAYGAGKGFKGTPQFNTGEEQGHGDYFCWRHNLGTGFRDGGTRYAGNWKWWFATNGFGCNQDTNGEYVWLSISIVDNGTYRYHGHSAHKWET